MDKNGVLLCATGQQHYYDLCNTIIRDLRAVMPETPIAVYTDKPEAIHDYDHVMKGEHNKTKVFASKIAACKRTPFYKNIFIDVDSRVVRSVNHLFDILDFHDFGIVFNDKKGNLRFDNWKPSSSGLPLCTSTFMFNMNDPVKALFEDWEDQYLNDKIFKYGVSDQPYLAYLLYYHTKIRYCVLPAEYHLNTDHAQVVGGSVKIVTSFVSDFDPKGKISRSKLDSIFNKHLIPRTIFISKLLGYKWKTKKHPINSESSANVLLKEEGLLRKVADFFNIRNLLSSLKNKND